MSLEISMKTLMNITSCHMVIAQRHITPPVPQQQQQQRRQRNDSITTIHTYVHLNSVFLLGEWFMEEGQTPGRQGNGTSCSVLVSNAGELVINYMYHCLWSLYTRNHSGDQWNEKSVKICFLDISNSKFPKPLLITFLPRISTKSSQENGKFLTEMMQ